MYKILVVLVLVLTGCATPPRWLSAHYDAQDPCQFQNIVGANLNEKVKNMPSFCGAGGSKTYIYDNNNRRIGYTKKQ